MCEMSDRHVVDRSVLVILKPDAREWREDAIRPFFAADVGLD